MSEQFKKYFITYSDDFKYLLKGLGNKFRFTISLYLLNKGEASLSEIARYSTKKNSLILNHISKLELGGMIQNYLQKREGTNEYSFYKLTEFGKLVISNIISILNIYDNYFEKITFLNYDDFINGFPDNFELSLKSINNKFRFILGLYLMENGSQTFSNIIRITNRTKGLVASHIKKLELGGILQNYFQKKEGFKEYSFYTITEFGKKLISKILFSYNSYYKKDVEEFKDKEKNALEESKSNDRQHLLID